MTDREAQSAWPNPFIEDFDDPDWPKLSGTDEEISHWVVTNRRLLMRTITWNMCAKPPPSKELLSEKLLVKKFHVYVFGTEECERSIAQSAINPSKKNWEQYLSECFGEEYVPLRSHTLQAIHAILFVHRAIAPLCSLVTSAAVATGVGNTLGNKGGVAVFLKVGSTRILIINSHLSAHQKAEKQRNSDYHKIIRLIPSLLEKRESGLTVDADNNPISPHANIGTASNNSSANPSPREDNDAALCVSANTSAMSSSSPTPSQPSPVAAAGPGIAVTTTTISGGIAEQSSAAIEPLNTIPTTTNNNSTEIVSTVNTVQNTASAAQPTTESSSTSLEQQLPPAIHTTAPAAAPEESDSEGEGEEETSSPPNPRMSDATLSLSQLFVGGGSRPPIDRKSFKSLSQCAEVVIFMGDLNYRIHGNRSIISKLLQANMHEVLLSNDQLKMNMKQGLVLDKFIEPPLNFRPTYKYDIGSNEYDTGRKQRIPSWTDRILYMEHPSVTCLAYNSVDDIMTSDHRPVYASFLIQFHSFVSLDEQQNAVVPNTGNAVKFTSESQVCSIM